MHARQAHTGARRAPRPGPGRAAAVAGLTAGLVAALAAALVASSAAGAARAGDGPAARTAAASPGVPSLPPARQAALVRLVRQDCGSCHGMRLTGGLGPAITREALAGRQPPHLALVILHGLPGTPMPGWRPMLGEDDAAWIAHRLLDGFPDEPASTGEPR